MADFVITIDQGTTSTRAIVFDNKLNPKASDIKSIGITNQRETTVIWDRKSGKTIHKAIVWQHRRTAEFCKNQKAQGHEVVVTQKTALLLNPYFSGTKITWTLDHVKGARNGPRRANSI